MKRRYLIRVTSFDELKAAFPLAVKEIVHQTHDYAYIARLIDCNLPIPGVAYTKADEQLDLVDKVAEAQSA